MPIPTRLPGLRTALVLLGVYVVVWIPLEGSLAQTALLALWVSLVAAGKLAERRWGGRTLSPGRWLLLATALGLAVGLSAGLLALAFMAMKTGLHAHGPEFSPAEIEWAIRQTPLWGAAGLLAGAGLGALAAGLGRRREE